MYLLTGCLCGEAPAARSRPPCRAGGFQAESRVAGAGGMRTPGGAWLRASARPHFHSKNWSVPDPAASPEAGNPPVSDRAVPPECSGGGRQAGLPREDCQTAVDSWGVSKHKCRRIPGSRPFPTAPPRWGTPSRGTTPHREIPGGGTRPGFAKGKIAKLWLAKSGVKAQAPSGTGNPLTLDPTVSPGRSQQRDTARFCQRQNRQTVVGKGERQSANVTGHREAVRARQYRLTGKLPAAGYDPVLPRAKSPNGGWQRAVSKLKRRQVPGSHSLPTTPPHRGTPSSGTQAGFAKGKIAKRRLAKGCVKAQMPPGTGKPLAPDNTVSPGNSQQWDTGRFCQRQNRQTVFGEGLCQSSNAFSV